MVTHNKKVLLVISNSFFTVHAGLDVFLKQFPGRIPTWMDFDFEIVSMLSRRRSDKYDFVIFYTDCRFYWWYYQPYPFMSELHRITYKKLLFVGFESNTVDGYNPVYARLFKEWPYRGFEAFILQKDFDYAKTHILDFIPYPTYLVVSDYSNILDHDFFNTHSPTKEKLLVMVSSNETYASHHPQRIEFAHRIKAHYQDQVDFFGRGFNDFDNKYHTLSPYKYMIVLENGIDENYWTEKLLDSYIAECYPIYSGCPNITDFFDKDSLTTIDISNFSACVRTIDTVMSENYFNKRYDKIMQAKKLCLTKYNLFNALRNHCLELEEADDR